MSIFAFSSAVWYLDTCLAIGADSFSLSVRICHISIKASDVKEWIWPAIRAAFPLCFLVRTALIISTSATGVTPVQAHLVIVSMSRSLSSLPR